MQRQHIWLHKSRYVCHQLQPHRKQQTICPFTRFDDDRISVATFSQKPTQKSTNQLGRGGAACLVYRLLIWAQPRLGC